MGYCSSDFGRKLRITSLLATISVVCVHTNYLERCANGSVAWWVGNIIAFMNRWAVPYFFVVSGFFFEREFENRNWLEYWPAFLRKKCRSLLVPYLLWGVVYGLVAMTLLKLGVAWQRGDADIWARTVFAQWGSWSFVDSLLGLTHAPLIGALWYVRVLLLVFIAAPLFVGVARASKWIVLVAAAAIIILSPISGMYEECFKLFGDVVFRIKVNAIGWILLGMVAGMFRADESFSKKMIGWVPFALWMLFALGPLPWLASGKDVPQIIDVLHQIHPVFAILALLCAGAWLSGRLPEKLPWVFSLGFWIYCVHHPITGYVGALGNIVLGRTMLAAYAMQGVGWIATVGISVLAAWCTCKLFPRAYNILCGGR